MTKSIFISVVDLHKGYQESQGVLLPVLKGISLKVTQGETLAVMGASGTGKSTLLHILGALDKANHGQVRVAGRDLGALTAVEAAQFRNQVLGFVFQFHHLLMDFTLLDNVMMPTWIAHGRRVNCQEHAEQILEAVGLTERAKHTPDQLSGGERQRAAIARALMHRPKLLLADEPTGNLDQTNTERITQLLLKLNKDFGLTLVLATHNPAVASQLSRHLLLRDGELHETSSVVSHA